MQQAEYDVEQQDQFWLTVNFVSPEYHTPLRVVPWLTSSAYVQTFARCCGSSLTLPMLPSLLIQDMLSGLIEVLGWDEENGILYANALSRPCNTCTRLLREELWRVRVEQGYAEESVMGDDGMDDDSGGWMSE